MSTIQAESSIKAIETRYKGYRFRSRLEARWAVFLDALGEPWEYEKEGYELPSGWYLPDFWLPRMNMWLEIKGQTPTHAEKLRCAYLAVTTKRAVVLADGMPDGYKRMLLFSGAVGFFRTLDQKLFETFSLVDKHPPVAISATYVPLVAQYVEFCPPSSAFNRPTSRRGFVVDFMDELAIHAAAINAIDAIGIGIGHNCWLSNASNRNVTLISDHLPISDNHLNVLADDNWRKQLTPRWATMPCQPGKISSYVSSTNFTAATSTRRERDDFRASALMYLWRQTGPIFCCRPSPVTAENKVVLTSAGDKAKAARFEFGEQG